MQDDRNSGTLKGYLQKLEREHRRLDRLIGTSKSPSKAEHVSALKRMRLRIKDRIVALRQQFDGRGLTG